MASLLARGGGAIPAILNTNTATGSRVGGKRSILTLGPRSFRVRPWKIKRIFVGRRVTALWRGRGGGYEWHLR